MAADGGKPVKMPDLNEIVNCFADSEKAIVGALGQVGQISQCLDTLAREANEAGLDVRAFELGAYHGRIATISNKLGNSAEDLMNIHKELYALAKGLDVPVPMPRTGGR